MEGISKGNIRESVTNGRMVVTQHGLLHEQCVFKGCYGLIVFLQAEMQVRKVAQNCGHVEQIKVRSRPLGAHTALENIPCLLEGSDGGLVVTLLEVNAADVSKYEGDFGMV